MQAASSLSRLDDEITMRVCANVFCMLSAANSKGRKMLVERKSISVGLHFRGAPQWGDDARDLATALAAEHDLAVQPGKMLFELRPGGADKGSAVRRLMTQPPMAGGVPVFIGDDVTDEEGFAAAAQQGGAGILVGTPRTTFAAFGLEQVAAVRHYLGEGAARLG